MTVKLLFECDILNVYRALSMLTLPSTIIRGVHLFILLKHLFHATLNIARKVFAAFLVYYYVLLCMKTLAVLPQRIVRPGFIYLLMLNSSIHLIEKKATISVSVILRSHYQKF